MLSTENLFYQFPNGREIVFPDINVAPSSTLLISGASGCGKTTLLHLLAGLKKPSAGKIKILNRDLNRLKTKEIDQLRGQSIGIVYQQSFFVEALSVLDNLLLSPYALNSKKAEENAGRLGINSLLSRKINQLSVGEQQRVSICRAMMNEPKMILADEPTSALDDKNCNEVFKLLKQEAKLQGAALIIVSHDKRLKDHLKQNVSLEAI